MYHTYKRAYARSEANNGFDEMETEKETATATQTPNNEQQLQ